MANRTDKEAAAIHGTNPQNLIEYISRQKIYDSIYWKQECFGLSAERLVDKAVEITEVGGMQGEPQKPTHFICLILKMLQIQPDKDIVVEFIKNDDFKYLRLLGAFYMRLVGRPLDVYQYLEPLYNDYRKVRIRNFQGRQELGHVDELIDAMLHKDRLFGIALPRLPARTTLEGAGQLEPRISVLDEEFDEAALEEQQEEQAAALQQAAAAAAAAEQQEQQEQQQAQGEEGEVREEGDGAERRREREKWQLSKEEKRRRERELGRSGSRSRSRSRERRGGRDERRDERRRPSRSRSRDGRDRRDDRDRRDGRRARSRSGDRRRRSRSRSRDRRDTRRDDRRYRSRSRDRHDERGRRDDRRDRCVWK
ncbi:hypothetical protein CHLNCDRAFT_49093 [Chlorella variabilis]|uniref:Pre-mRNA-splicing factor 38 n=1 Tax=Chlorella variabilis TaxID=554065 RepID=E1ZNW2_CHLVA|nr:hypothetical protein CHLNCDRAFT_49093 [Chlorella variabilis]EFN52507.1 hypothetical protein CHLNCDRAFT_49093 [Chlorella variabilis]|eukprot:XP_005844609.1 hypothetical protein CHLNCDRAFT_49093 [Chlorella variabilis]